ncbi:hypothetical protein MMC29_001981 [Sticta canariensis]|nr:hypothetical protein [Sticta canariensis]
MHTKIIWLALFSSVFTATAEPAPQPDAQTTKEPSAAQTSKAYRDYVSYRSSITAAPKWPSISSVIDETFASVTLAFDELVDNLLAEDLSDITPLPEWTSLPKEEQDFIVSVNKAANSAYSKDINGGAPKPTGAVMAAGAAAAGLLGVVAML